MISIYGLINPLNNHIFYVGATTNPNSRLKQHIAERNAKSSFKNNQILKIVAAGLQPEILVLEMCELSDTNFSEEFYMSLFQFYGFRIEQRSYSGYTSVKNPYFKFTTHIGKKRTTFALIKDTQGYIQKVTLTTDNYELTEGEARLLLDKDFKRSFPVTLSE